MSAASAGGSRGSRAVPAGEHANPRESPLASWFRRIAGTVCFVQVIDTE